MDKCSSNNIPTTSATTIIIGTAHSIFFGMPILLKLGYRILLTISSASITDVTINTTGATSSLNNATVASIHPAAGIGRPVKLPGALAFTLNRASLIAPHIGNSPVTIQEIAGATSCSATTYIINAGATPNEIISANESSS